MPAAPLPVFINAYLRPADMALPAFLDRVAAHGFCGVGLTQRALDDMTLPALRRELRARELAVSSLNSAGYFVADDMRPHAARNLALLDTAAALGAHALNVIVGATPALPLREARARAAEGLSWLAGEAAARGVTLVLEPLHPNTAQLRSCLNTLAQCAALAPGMPVNLDYFHLWWDPDLDGLTDGAGPPLGLVQVCDVGGGLPDGGLPRRLPLDEGLLQAGWRDLVARVRARWPAVSIELELFADQLPGRDIDPILADTARLLAPCFPRPSGQSAP